MTRPSYFLRSSSQDKAKNFFFYHYCDHWQFFKHFLLPLVIVFMLESAQPKRALALNVPVNGNVSLFLQQASSHSNRWAETIAGILSFKGRFWSRFTLNSIVPGLNHRILWKKAKPRPLFHKVLPFLQYKKFVANRIRTRIVGVECKGPDHYITTTTAHLLVMFALR